MDGNRTLRRALGATIGLAAFSIALARLLQAETDPPERLYCAALALTLAVFLAVAWGRIGFGFLTAGALAGAVWLAGALKLAYLHEPLMAPDLLYFTGATTLDVIAHYPTLWHKCAAALLGGLALAALLWRLESPGLWRRRRTHAAVGLLASLPLLTVAWPSGPLSDVHAVSTWDFMSQATRNPTTTFLNSFARMRVTMPAFTPGAANAFDWGSASAATAATRPDLVAVLEESTVDPRRWAACTVPRCTLAMFEPDQDTRAHGALAVHTYGGATWTSEFAFLAGMPHTLFGPAGIYAPYNLAPRVRESLPRQLRALGYRTIAVYPAPRHFVRAAEAYADYGFDAFYDADDIGLGPYWESTDLDLVRRFAGVLQRERAKDDRPLFFMLLTMHQHGPHDHPLDTLPPPWNEQPAPALGERMNRNLGTYLFRAHESDQAVAMLRELLFDGRRPVALLHFGDHHPSFDGIERTLQPAAPDEAPAAAANLTYYRIDSNFAAGRIPAYRTLDIAFLGGVLLDVAQLPKNAYFEANTRLRERCAGRYEDCADKTVLESYLARTFGELNAFQR